MKPWVFLAGWQKIAWALDEDLRWARRALGEDVVFSGLSRARIVLAAWWPAVEALGPGALRGKTVVCFADNPPAFYLTRPGFAEVADRVDLWIARSREAGHQFQALGLPVAQVPYCVDPKVFCPGDSRAARAEWGIPDSAFVVGNFHRDSEGADLSRPKRQKAADVLLEIVGELHRRVPRTLVLLAGPRRHWLLRGLESAGIPFRFAGCPPGLEDDYEQNILDRPTLNRLYQALDACVIPSRWEGGPYAVLEALLGGCPVVSTPVGMARDLLPATALYSTPAEAVALLERAASGESLPRPDRAAVLATHSVEILRERLREIFRQFPAGPAPFSPVAALSRVAARFMTPAWRHPRASVVGVRDQMPSAPGTTPFYLADKPDKDALVASARGIGGTA